MQISGGERALAVLGYLPLLFIIPVKAKRNSIFVQFHARQGAVLFGLWAVLALVLFIVLIFVDSIDWAATIIISILFLATVLYLVMMLIGILKVALGERYRMPVVADVALKLGL